jgi:hypothetical protein
MNKIVDSDVVYRTMFMQIKENTMVNRITLRRFRIGFILVALLLTTLIAAPVVGQANAPAGITIPYSGQLTGENGKPVADGAYDFTFTFYDSVEGGVQLWSEAQADVSVRGGTFAVILGSVNPLPDTVKGVKLWLDVKVRGPQDAVATSLEPRQQLSPASSVSPSNPTGGGGGSTCAHNHLYEYWSGSSTSYTLEVENAGTGDGIRAYSSATLPNYAALYAVNNSSGSGVWASSATGRAVYGESNGGDAIEGSSTGIGMSGVYGHSNTGYGVTGRTSSTSIAHAAVQGANSGNGYGGSFTADNFRGLYAKGSSGWYAAYFENPNGAPGAGLYVNGYAWVTGNLEVSGNLTVHGSKTGYVVDIAVNDGPETLETGDVVVITGYGDPVIGQTPVVRVRKATQAGSKAVMGVVDQPLNAPTAQSNQEEQAPLETSSASALKAEGTAIAPGQYLNVVTLGAFKVVKVDASILPVHAGDLLVASANPGYAMVSDDPKLGSVIGKALGECPSGMCLIPVLVTLK